MIFKLSSEAEVLIFMFKMLINENFRCLTVESTLVGSKKMQKDTFMFKLFKMCSKRILSVPEHV